MRDLIDNALEYAGSACVGVAIRDGCVLTEAYDTGPGIPAAQLQLVQEPFVRLEQSRSRATGGTGLGLILTRAAAQLHGGDLVLENRPEGGLCARLSLAVQER